MKFLKSMKNIGKNIAKGIKKGMELGEKIVNTADKATGGQLRSMLGSYTGGKSEALLMGYKGIKPGLTKGIDVIEGKKNIRQALDGTKYAEKYDRGLEHIRSGLSHAEKTGLFNEARNNAHIKPFMKHSGEVKKILGV